MRKIILTAIALMLLSSFGYSADWKSFGKDEDNNEWFYDTQTIARDQDTIKVWTKIVLSDKAKAYFIKKSQPKKPPSLSYEPPEFFSAQKEAELSQKDRITKENISHRMDRDEIDCVTNRIKIISSAWFDFTEDLIYSENPPDPIFKEIDPDSVTAKLVEIVCKMRR